MDVFISYRRDDSAALSRLIHHALCEHLDADDVFMDVEDIGWGEHFVQAIDRRLARADVVVVVIGPRWAEMLQQRLRGDDWVRHEVGAALQRQRIGTLRVVPVFIDGAALVPQALPPELADLAFLNGPSFSQKDLDVSLQRVVEAVRNESFQDEAKRGRVSWRSVLVALLPAGLLAVATTVSALDLLGLDHAAQRLGARLAGVLAPEQPASGHVVLLAIDDATFAHLGRTREAGLREALATVVRRTADAEAASLAIDIGFASERPGTAALADALRDVATRPGHRMPVVIVSSAVGADGGPATLSALMPWVRVAPGCAEQTGSVTHEQMLAWQPARAASKSEPECTTDWRPGLALAAVSGGAPLPKVCTADLVALRLPVRALPADAATRTSAVALRPTPPDVRACPGVPPGGRRLTQSVVRTPPGLRAGGAQRVRFEAVHDGDVAAGAALRGRVVVIGDVQTPADLHVTDAGPVSGPELVAAQADAIVRDAALGRVGPLMQTLPVLALTLAGVALARALRGTRLRWPWPAVAGAAAVAGLLWLVLAVAWQVSDAQVVPWPYGVLALLAGAFVVWRLERR